MKYLICVAVLFGAGAASADCPANVDISDQLDRAYADIAMAPSQARADEITGYMWSLWTKAPDAKAQDLLDRGMTRIHLGTLEFAQDVLSDLVAYCPNYAEGWNQRAFARYLLGDFENALADLQRAMDLRPRHLGVLSGKALTHMQLGQNALAEIEIRKALKLNPWTPERRHIPQLGTDL